MIFLSCSVLRMPNISQKETHEQNDRHVFVFFANGNMQTLREKEGSSHDSPEINILTQVKGKVCGVSQVAHQAGAYPGFCSMKRLGVFLVPPGWDASPSQGYPQ